MPIDWGSKLKQYGVSADWAKKNANLIRQKMQGDYTSAQEAQHNPFRGTAPFYDEGVPQVDDGTGQAGGQAGAQGLAEGTGYDRNNPFGPSPAEQIQGMGSAGAALWDAGIDINRSSGAKAAEVLYPYQRDAYNQAMQNKALVQGLQSKEDFLNDPTLNATSQLMADKLANPYTFDENTISLMQSNTADQLANQEAAMGERLRSMGATQGWSPDSPMYQSMAQQAVLARDINQSNADRQMQMDIARQKQQDRESAIAMGGQFGGAYQGMMGQQNANIQNLMVGGKVADMGNPFAGLWQGMAAQNQMNTANQLSLMGMGGSGGSSTGNTMAGIGGMMQGAGGLMQGLDAVGAF